MIHFGLPTFTFDFCFWDESLDGARGRRRALRKHRPGTAFCCSQPKGFRKERRRACGPRPTPEKTRALWFREAWCCPRAPAGAPKYLIPLCFCKSDGGGQVHFGFFRLQIRRGWMILEVDAVLGEASQENHFKGGCLISEL